MIAMKSDSMIMEVSQNNVNFGSQKPWWVTAVDATNAALLAKNLWSAKWTFTETTILERESWNSNKEGS